MDYFVVNQNKIKITLTHLEIKKYSMRFSNGALPENFAGCCWNLLDDVSKQQPGVNFGDRLLVQVYTVESGAELFVTKLGRSCDSVEKISSKATNTVILASKRAIFPFDSIDELISAALHTSTYECYASSLYYSDDGTYYLFCEERGAVGACSYVYRLSEFSKPLPPIMHSYVAEHCKKIISKNAISVLCSVADGE